jgi:hypothetical protein
MKNRIHTGLLVVVIVLLGAQWLRDRVPSAHAEESGESRKVIRAEVFELIGDNGQVRSRLHVEPNGEVVFRLMDQEGTIRVKLAAAKDGSGLLLINDATEPGVHILAKGKGSSLKLTNRNGAERLIQP